MLNYFYSQRALSRCVLSCRFRMKSLLWLWITLIIISRHFKTFEACGISYVCTAAPSDNFYIYIYIYIYIRLFMNNIMFIIRAGFIRYSVVSALEVIRCNWCLVMNNELKQMQDQIIFANSKYLSKLTSKVTSHIPSTEWGLLIWVGSFLYQVMEHPWEWQLHWQTGNTPESILDGWAYTKKYASFWSNNIRNLL